MDLSRRDVLAGGAALGLASALPSGPQERPVGYAVLGLGGYAQGQILPAFARAKGSRLVALISGTPEKLTRLGDQYGVPANRRFSYAEMDRIAEVPEIEAVYVITPPGTHEEFAARAFRAGKHVLSEKPMAATSAQAGRMIAAGKAARRLLMIGYRCHFEANNRRAIQACASGELGTLRSIASEHGFQGPRSSWRTQDRALAGGGALWDIGIYGVQAALYLSGAEPTRVVALGDKLEGDPRFKEVDDVTHMVLAFPNGVTASVATGYSWAGANNYRVVGTKANLVAEPATSYSGNRLTIAGTRYDPGEAQDQFSAQLDHFARAIRSGEPIRTPGEMGLRDLRILEAARLSAQEGGRPIELKL